MSSGPAPSTTRRPLGRSPASPAPVTSLVSIAWIASLAALVVLLVLASSGGVVRVWSEPPPRSVDPATQVVGTDPPQGTGVSQGKLPAATDVDGDGWWMRAIAVVLAVVLGRVAWITVRFWWEVFRNRRRRERGPTGARFDTLPAVPEPVEVHVDLDAHAAVLAEGAPRNAIVRCWLLLEDDVAAAGMPRRASETTVEYTGRVLAAALVDPSASAAVDELAELYREARFSAHVLDDDRRATAFAALRTIHAALRPVAAGSVDR